jgi:hypothetical protein
MEKLTKEEKAEFYREIRAIVRSEVEEAINLAMAPLAEDFESRYSLIVEGFIAMDGRMDAVQIVLNSHTEMLGILMMDIEIIKQSFSYLNSSIDSP